LKVTKVVEEVKIPEPIHSKSKPNTAKVRGGNGNVTSDSDSDAGNMDPEFYKDSRKIFQEAKLCRGCNTTYATPKDASDCITDKHKLVRCYFCFGVFKNTEALFEHYGAKHRKAGRENCLICPYCQQTIPHRSISTHVISNHIYDKKDDVRIKQGNSPAVVVKTPPVKRPRLSDPKDKVRIGPASKKLIGGMKLLREEVAGQSVESDDELISSKNMVIKKKSDDGNVRVFVLSKDKGKK
jgi:hypothetical protein